MQPPAGRSKPLGVMRERDANGRDFFNDAVSSSCASHLTRQSAWRGTGRTPEHGWHQLPGTSSEGDSDSFR